MECKYLKISNAYYFYITVEAIEEGNLGVYETKVVCTSDGGSRRTLTKCFLTDRKPVGTKTMAISHFACQRSLCKALHCVTDRKNRDLDRIFDGFPRRCCSGRHEDQGRAFHQLSCLLELRTETIKGLHRELSLGLQFLFSPDCNLTTNPDVWSHPDNYLYIGKMVQRTKDTPCKGYDYHNPYGMGRGHYYFNPSGVGSVRWCGQEANIADVGKKLYDCK